MTIPVTPSGNYLLIKVYRQPTKRYLWEFPAGVMDDGESPLEAAHRELAEETGVTATRIELLGSQTPVAGYAGNIFHSFVAEIPEISLDDVNLQADEGIVDSKLLSRREWIVLIDREEVGDGVMLTCLARYWMRQELETAEPRGDV